MLPLVDEESFGVSADRLRVSRRVLTEIERLNAQHGNVEKLPHIFFHDFVEKEFPGLFLLLSKIRSLLVKGHRFVVLRKLPLTRYKPEIRDFLFLAVASCIGRPTATDQVERKVLWEVTARSYLPDMRIPTVTEHNLQADLHTDTSYKDRPERFVALLAVRAARDGGGLSQILDGRKLLLKLARSSSGVECLKALSSLSFPFRVPTSFTKAREEKEPEIILAPIISDVPLIRFRYDVVMSGFKCSPAYATKDALWAVNYFHESLESSRKLTFKLNSGEILFTNNYEILHGRTAFKDMRRLLLRVRMESLSESASDIFPESESE